MRQRSVALCVVLTIVTCGIYGLYWMAKLNDEITTVAGNRETTGGTVVLLSIVTCGIYGIYWRYKMGEAVEWIHDRHQEPRSSAPILYLILAILGLGIIADALMQSELNKYLPYA